MLFYTLTASLLRESLRSGIRFESQPSRLLRRPRQARLIPVAGATLLKGSRNGYLFSLPCRDSATSAALRFFHRVILSVVEIRAKRGSNGTKCHSGSRWKKFDSLRSLRMTRQGVVSRKVGLPLCNNIEVGLNSRSDGNLTPLLILFPKIVFFSRNREYCLTFR